MRFLFLVAMAAAYAEMRTPVVVELFTSEGCSSCPPADRVLANYEKAAPPGIDVIALGEHVDYCDYLGWKDRFSSSQFTTRQQIYAQFFHLGSAYTPQMVVGGQFEVLGSDATAVRKAIVKAAQTPRTDVTLTARDADTVVIDIANIPATSKGVGVYTAITEGSIETKVGAGENARRTLQHTGVVRNLTMAGKVPMKSAAYQGVFKVNAKPDWNRGNMKAVVFLQDLDTLHIIGAASMSIVVK